MANVTPNILVPDFDRTQAVHAKSKPGNRQNSDNFDRFLDRPADQHPRDVERTERARHSDHTERTRDTEHTERARDTEHTERARDSRHADRKRDAEHAERARDAGRDESVRDGDGAEKPRDAEAAKPARDPEHAERSDETDHADTASQTLPVDEQPASEQSANPTAAPSEQLTSDGEQPASAQTVQPADISESPSTEIAEQETAAPEIEKPPGPADTTETATVLEDFQSDTPDTSVSPLPGLITQSEQGAEAVAPVETQTASLQTPSEPVDPLVTADLPETTDEPVTDAAVQTPVSTAAPDTTEQPVATTADTPLEPAAAPEQPDQVAPQGEKADAETTESESDPPDDGAPVHDHKSRPPVPQQALKGLQNAAGNLPEHYSGNGRPGEIEPLPQDAPDTPEPKKDAAADLTSPPDGEPLPIPAAPDDADSDPVLTSSTDPVDAIADLPGPGEQPSLAPQETVPGDTPPEPQNTAPSSDEAALNAPQNTQPAPVAPQASVEAPAADRPVEAIDSLHAQTAPTPQPDAPGSQAPQQPAVAPQPNVQATADTTPASEAVSKPATSAPVLPVSPAEAADKPANQTSKVSPDAAEPRRNTTPDRHADIPSEANTKAPVPAPKPSLGLLRQAATPENDDPAPSNTPAKHAEPSQIRRPNPLLQQTTEPRAATTHTQQGPSASITPLAQQNAPAAADSSTPAPEPTQASTPATSSASAEVRPAPLPLAQNSQAISIQFGTSPLANNGLQTPVNTIAFNIAKHFDNGVTKFQVRIDPPELGRVDVKLDMSVEGRVHAHLTVERAETLDLMMRDARALEKALADTGLNLNKDSLSFSLKDQGTFDADGMMREHSGDAEDRTDSQVPVEDLVETAPDNTVRGYISDTGVDISV